MGDPIGALQAASEVLVKIWEIIQADAANQQAFGDIRVQVAVYISDIKKLRHHCSLLSIPIAKEPLERLQEQLNLVLKAVEGFVAKGTGRWRRAIQFLRAHGVKDELETLESELHITMNRLLSMANLEAHVTVGKLILERLDTVANLATAHKNEVKAIITAQGDPHVCLIQVDQVAQQAGLPLLQSRGLDSDEDLMDNKHMQAVLHLIQQQQQQQRQQQHFDPLPARSTQCSFCVEDRQQDPVMIDNLAAGGEVYCLACISQWLDISSKGGMQAPQVEGKRLEGSCCRLLPVLDGNGQRLQHWDYSATYDSDVAAFRMVWAAPKVHFLACTGFDV